MIARDCEAGKRIQMKRRLTGDLDRVPDQCPDSEVRKRLRHPLMRTSESKGHWQLYDSSAVLNLKFLYEIATRMIGTSNSPH